MVSHLQIKGFLTIALVSTESNDFDCAWKQLPPLVWAELGSY